VNWSHFQTSTRQQLGLTVLSAHVSHQFQPTLGLKGKLETCPVIQLHLDLTSELESCTIIQLHLDLTGEQESCPIIHTSALRSHG
jgi:hypothetical protein